MRKYKLKIVKATGVVDSLFLIVSTIPVSAEK